MGSLHKFYNYIVNCCLSSADLPVAVIKKIRKVVIVLIRITNLERNYLVKHGAMYGKDLHTTYVGHTYVTESKRNLTLLAKCNRTTETR